MVQAKIDSWGLKNTAKEITENSLKVEAQNNFFFYCLHCKLIKWYGKPKHMHNL